MKDVVLDHSRLTLSQRRRGFLARKNQLGQGYVYPEHWELRYTVPCPSDKHLPISYFITVRRFHRGDDVGLNDYRFFVSREDSDSTKELVTRAVFDRYVNNIRDNEGDEVAMKWVAEQDQIEVMRNAEMAIFNGLAARFEATCQLINLAFTF